MTYFTTELTSIMIFVAASLVLSFILFVVVYLIGFTSKVDYEKSSAYECGFAPFSETSFPFEVQFALIAILFLLFDIEILYLFPLVTLVLGVTFTNVLCILVFFTMLIISIIYEISREVLSLKQKTLNPIAWGSLKEEVSRISSLPRLSSLSSVSSLPRLSSLSNITVSNIIKVSPMIASASDQEQQIYGLIIHGIRHGLSERLIELIALEQGWTITHVQFLDYVYHACQWHDLETSELTSNLANEIASHSLPQVVEPASTIIEEVVEAVVASSTHPINTATAALPLPSPEKPLAILSQALSDVPVPDSWLPWIGFGIMIIFCVTIMSFTEYYRSPGETVANKSSVGENDYASPAEASYLFTLSDILISLTPILVLVLIIVIFKNDHYYKDIFYRFIKGIHTKPYLASGAMPGFVSWFTQTPEEAMQNPPTFVRKVGAAITNFVYENPAPFFMVAFVITMFVIADYCAEPVIAQRPKVMQPQPPQVIPKPPIIKSPELIYPDFSVIQYDPFEATLLGILLDIPYIIAAILFYLLLIYIIISNQLLYLLTCLYSTLTNLQVCIYFRNRRSQGW